MRLFQADKVSASWDPENEILLVTLSGDVSWPAIDQLLHAVVRSEYVPAVPDMIWDCREMMFSAVSPERLQSASVSRAKWIEHFSGFNSAVVVGSKADATIMKLFDGFTKTDGVKNESFFGSVTDAQQWLLSLRTTSKK